MPTRFALPAAEPAVLTRHPVLASWDRADHPSRARLAQFLAAVEEDAEPALTGGPVLRWDERPMTRFERKGLEAGRAITDLAYTRV